MARGQHWETEDLCLSLDWFKGQLYCWTLCLGFFVWKQRHDCQEPYFLQGPLLECFAHDLNGGPPGHWLPAILNKWKIHPSTATQWLHFMEGKLRHRVLKSHGQGHAAVHDSWVRIIQGQAKAQYTTANLLDFSKEVMKQFTTLHVSPVPCPPALAPTSCTSHTQWSSPFRLRIITTHECPPFADLRSLGAPVWGRTRRWCGLKTI